ncbi:unnamed protein product [Kuraishia capsulata CBS 1993]|uniref:C2H2-type domain-containing protein n=1 Tax=Kuraishia capsulata CBS 1993 TaxID=1382522 RepID=W6MQ59_9ASCO|nr:uncharacterized protein KUCA_T00003370001 [Kuraishia capsulata CBS 1993]CDK27392.1 unnamed protein product [Kuraishia capsulata CBS 1993]
MTDFLGFDDLTTSMFKPDSQIGDITLVKSKPEDEFLDSHLRFHQGLQLYTPISPVSCWESEVHEQSEFPYSEDSETLLSGQLFTEMALPSLILEPSSGSISPDLISNPTTPDSSSFDNNFQVTSGNLDYSQSFHHHSHDHENYDHHANSDIVQDKQTQELEHHNHMNGSDLLEGSELKTEMVLELGISSEPEVNSLKRRAASEGLFDEEELKMKFSRRHTTDAIRQHDVPNALIRNRCAICNKQFKRPSSLQTHMYSHTGEKPFKCDWNMCGKVFSVRSNMVRHYRLHEKDERKLFKLQDSVKRK